MVELVGIDDFPGALGGRVLAPRRLAFTFQRSLFFVEIVAVGDWTVLPGSSNVLHSTTLFWSPSMAMSSRAAEDVLVDLAEHAGGGHFTSIFARLAGRYRPC